MTDLVYVACEIVVRADSPHDGAENVRDILGSLVGLGDIHAAYVGGPVESPSFAEAVSFDGEPIRLDEDTLAIEAGEGGET